MKRHAWPFLVLLCAGLLAVWTLPCWTSSAYAEKLPVFKLKAPNVNRTQADAILNDLHKGKPPGPPQKGDRADALVSHSGKKSVEISKNSGAVFAADSERLWNPGHKPSLPSQQEAKSRADAFLGKHKLLPSGPDQHTSSKFDGFSETKAISNAPNATPLVLDTQVNYKMEVKARVGGRDVMLPVVGGGGKVKVHVGDRGDIVGVNGNWKNIDRVESEEEILPQAEAEKQFQQAHQGQNLARVSSSLAYYAAPSAERQTHMAPVWVVDGSTKVGDQEVPVRTKVIPATKYGPAPPSQQPSPPRDPNQKPLAGNRPEKSGKISEALLDWLFRPAWAETSYKKFGVEYIGLSGGLGASASNGIKFANVMKSGGWINSFIYGDRNVWETDWSTANNTWVDAVDLVFYTGHASPSGWMVFNPPAAGGASTLVSYNRVNSMYPDLWGNNQLEWIVIAACGPLQDPHFTSNINSAFDRWGKAFNGLHALMGYGAVTYDQDYEGPRLASLLLSGKPVIDAWFQTATEAQPSNNGYSAPNGPRIYVAVMWAEPTTTFQVRYDRIWGRGYTAPDAVTTKYLWLMWQQT